MSNGQEHAGLGQSGRQIADSASHLGQGDLLHPIVPAAIRIAWWAAMLSCTTLVMGTIAVIFYGRSRAGNAENHNVFGEIALVAVPLILWPLLWVSFGYMGVRRLQRGDHRLSVMRSWLALPLLVTHVLMVSLAGVFVWPHLDLIMLSLAAYIITEILFAASGIYVWRTHR